MLQRIQTLFLLGAIIILIIVSFWGDFFVYVTDEAFYYFSAEGIVQKTLDNKEIMSTTEVPLYVLTLAMVIFAFYIMFYYKNLSRQLVYAKLFWGIYFAALLSVIVLRFYVAPSLISGKTLNSDFSYNFYLMVIGLPFVHLAMLNIGKDKSKIDALNRLR